jgi:hypothetical protein
MVMHAPQLHMVLLILVLILPRCALHQLASPPAVIWANAGLSIAHVPRLRAQHPVAQQHNQQQRGAEVRCKSTC